MILCDLDVLEKGEAIIVRFGGGEGGPDIKCKYVWVWKLVMLKCGWKQFRMQFSMTTFQNAFSKEIRMRNCVSACTKKAATFVGYAIQIS